MDATAAMAPRAEASPFRKRLVSAAILLPLAAVAVWLGPPYWDILVGAIAVVMAWEWSGMCAFGQLRSRRAVFGVEPAGAISMLAMALAMGVAAFQLYRLAVLLLVLGGALSSLMGMRRPGERSVWQGFGTLYIGLPSIAIIWLRAQAPGGLATMVWVLALVIAVDTGAYAAGRSIGGPKLAPRISPNKTWAGLLGGVAAGMVVGLAAALWLGAPSVWPLVQASALLGIVEQAGDLMESGFKRYFGVKDSGRLIPGHGGFLDRVDGLLAVALAVALAQSLGGGILAWTR
jgi:phosphatidate cytidylyltransferase